MTDREQVWIVYDAESYESTTVVSVHRSETGAAKARDAFAEAKGLSERENGDWIERVSTEIVGPDRERWVSRRVYVGDPMPLEA